MSPLDQLHDFTLNLGSKIILNKGTHLGSLVLNELHSTTKRICICRETFITCRRHLVTLE